MDNTKKSKDRLIRELSEARELIEILRKQVVMSNEEEIAFAESDSGQKSFTQHDYLPTLVNLLHSLVYVKDLKSEFLFANDSCARFMGVTSCNELIGKTDLDFYPPDIASRFIIEEMEVLKGIPMINKEDIRHLPGGQNQFFLTSKVPLHDRNGNIIGLVGNSQDITDLKNKENALRESEEWFRNLFEQSGDGIFYSTFDGRILSVNSAFAQMHGYTIDEILNMNIEDLDCADIKQLFPERSERMHQGEKLKFEVEHFHKDGHKIPMEVTTGKIIVGATPYIMASIRDISARKQAEEALRISEEKFSKAFLSSPDSITITSIRTGELIEVNNGFEDMFGFLRSEAIGHTTTELRIFAKPGAREKFIKEVTLNGNVRNLELEGCRKNGEHFIGLLSAEIINISGERCIVTIVRNITESKLLEAKITESEAYYRSLVDISPDGICILNLNGEIVYASKKLFEIFEIPSNIDVLGTSILRWVTSDYQERVLSRVQGILLGNEISGIREYQFMNYNNGTFWAEVMSSPIADARGKINELLVVCRDITERKKAEAELLLAKEKAEESDKLKTAFLNNISHEIRTPLNAIVGFSALLSENSYVSEGQKSNIDLIINSSDHLLAVVNDIVEVSNIEVGILKFNKNELNLNVLLKNLYEQFVPISIGKGLGFRYEAALSDNKAFISADKTKLIQIISNLLSNAFKFTSKGQINFGYTLKDGKLEFFVSDTGIGIREDQHSRIFDRFYQVENSTTREFEGTGLGLSISKAYVELQDGRIWLESEPGKGTTFFFTLSFEQVLNPKNPDQIFLKPEKKAKSETKTLLIAEDDDNSFILLVQLLSGFNFNILHARDGIEAVELCKKGQQIDLILMDIKMPEMDGYIATQQILTDFPFMKIIAQTAFADDEVKAIKAGCIGFVSKPIKRDKLIALIKEHLRIENHSGTHFTI